MTEKKPTPEESRFDPERLRHRVIIAGAVTLVAAVVAIAGLSLVRHARIVNEAKRRDDEQKAGQVAVLSKVIKASPFREVLLIGEARPFYDVVIYSRAAGYLVQLNVDKGDHVNAGTVLAKIESPETDKAYFSALSDWYNKKRIADRDRILLKRKLISQQDADLVFATADMAAATLETQRVLRSYETVVAPFSGTVANRYVDPGALVQDSTANQAAGGALFEISQNDRLRIYAYPDQPDAAFIKPGTPVWVTLAERPDFRIDATVTRNSELLDSKTRKLLTEIDIDNPDGKLVAGSFVQVHIRINEGERLEVPVQAVTLRGEKTSVPVVDPNGIIHYRDVTIGDNNGQQVRVLSGLKEGELVALNLGNSVVDGTKIRGRMAGMIAQQEKEQKQQAGTMPPSGPGAPAPLNPQLPLSVPALYPRATQPVTQPYARPELPEHP